MQCRYVRMAILEHQLQDLFSQGQTREEFIKATLSENAQFNHNRSSLFYSPRYVSDEIIAGVIERKVIETYKTGPWKNELKEQEAYKTTNFAIRLNQGQEVVIQDNSEVFSGEAVDLFRSLAKSFNDPKHHAWYIDFRHVGSQRELDDYIVKHSGAMRKITITFEIPNADYSLLQSVHDDLRESLLNIRGDKLKKEYNSSQSTLTPDQRVLDEMHLANGGTGQLKIQNKDDQGNRFSYNSASTEFTATIDENRRIEELSNEQDILSVAEAMLNGAESNE